MRWRGPIFVAMLLMLGAQPVAAAEFRAGLGAFLFGSQGRDLQLSLRPADGRWAYGIRYVSWVDTFVDPYTGTDLTETTETRGGLTVDYLFSPGAAHSWYLAAAVMLAEKQEHSLITLETGTDSVTSLYLGGGFTGTFAERFYYDLGMLISPGAELATSTSVSSEEDSGMFDIRLVVGVRL